MTTRRRTSYSSIVAVAVVVLLSVGHAYSDNNDNSNNSNNSPLPPLQPQRVPRQLDDTNDVNVASPVLSDVRDDATPHNETGSLNRTLSAIPDISSYSNTQLYSLLIDVLEKLNVLQQNAASCHQLQKIVQKILPGDATSKHSAASRSVEVFLYFKESALTTDNGGNPSKTSSANAVANSASGSRSADGVHSQPVAPACVSAPDFIVSMDAQPLVRDGVLNDTHGRRVDPSPTPGNESRGSGAGQGTGPSGKLEYNNEDEREEEPDRFGGLSRTQVVVISTCSAIIALFFLVAGILRVRNYIKRVREEQMLAQRPTFRSCSVRLRSVSQSNDPVRRDSQVSKLSHQSNYNNRSQGYSLTNGSTSRDHSNASSPNHDPDTKPLLVVTAVTEAGRSPSVSQSSSLQFIDEEPRKKTERAPPQGQEQGDEYRPLLGSETSANSLLVSPTSPTGNGFSNGQVNNGRLLGTRPPANLAAADIGVETYFQRVSDSPSPKNGRAGILETTFADSSRQHPQQQRQSPPEKNGKSAKLIPKKSNGVVEIPDKRNGGVEIPIKSNGVVEIPVKSNGVVEIPTKSNGVVEIPHNGVVEIPLIRFCGLTQSDTSLSSMDGNRNYNYGNQSEYTPPYLGYLAGAEYINGLNSPYALALLTNPNGVFRNTQNAQNSVPKDRPYAAPCFGDSRNNKGQVTGNDAAADKKALYQQRLSSVEVPLTLPVQRQGSDNGTGGPPGQGHSDEETQRSCSPPSNSAAGVYRHPQAQPNDAVSARSSDHNLVAASAAVSREPQGRASSSGEGQLPVGHAADTAAGSSLCAGSDSSPPQQTSCEAKPDSAPCSGLEKHSTHDSGSQSRHCAEQENSGYPGTAVNQPRDTENSQPQSVVTRGSDHVITNAHDPAVGDVTSGTDTLSSALPLAEDKKEKTNISSSVTSPNNDVTRSSINSSDCSDPVPGVLKAILSLDDERATFL